MLYWSIWFGVIFPLIASASAIYLYAARSRSRRADGECGHSYERDCVPVIITLATGPTRIAWLCLKCDRTIYLMRWLREGKGEDVDHPGVWIEYGVQSLNSVRAASGMGLRERAASLDRLFDVLAELDGRIQAGGPYDTALRNKRGAVWQEAKRLIEELE